MEASSMETRKTSSPEKVSSTTNDDKHFQINDVFYLARLNSNDYQKCSIVQIRTNEKDKKEYYIHYTGLNRRLDEWITQEKLNTAKTEEEFKNDNNREREQENQKNDLTKANSTKTLKELSKSQISSLNNSSVDNSDRKITRHQKRRHDEINHVQKTYAEMDPTTAALGMFFFKE